ncbi:MAG: ABC transporter permease, partial [Acidobacteriota bacterium]
MLLFEAIQIAVDNLARHKLRTCLTMLGIIFGVAAVLSMLSIGAGAEKEALSVIQKMGLRNIIVEAKDFEKEELEILRQDSPGLSRLDLEALNRALPPETLVVGKRDLRTYQIVSAQGKSDSRVWGVGALFPLTTSLEILEGAFFLPFDEVKAYQVCVLGRTARRKLFGVSPAVGQQIKINQEWFAVVGVLADQLIEQEEFEGIKVANPNNEIYIPLQTLLTKFEMDPVEDELDEIIVRVPEDLSIQEQASLIS